MAKGLKLDDTLDTVARTLSHRPEISLGELKAISAEVTGMTDPEEKRTRILELADQIEIEMNPAVKR